ncbi:hypothetical protein GR211_33295 [Rhizobium leguminosarum]|uniref:hypothetical protein n=1 Tax=Rhizobium ruizarguesonis TaxID=2081791 RepID=UPI0013B974DE|nr:hypothetical protein [Rhizobium ruizarguesonis]NEJ17725.1 hypothetical protein [Rhizobium ruizarguesonis]NEK31703.1 hypothetical protein [Rhizobium ruizarguesonis]
MIDFNEKRQLETLLVEAVIGMGDAANLIAALPANLRPLFAPSGSFGALVANALALCVSDGYNARPSSLSCFLRNMADLCADLAAEALERFADRLAMPAPVSHDPFDDIVLRPDLPFLDRQQLRKALRVTISGTDYPILLINGPSGSGKSFAARLLDHLVKHLPDLEHCIVRTPDGSDLPTALEVAKDMLTNLGARSDNLPPQVTNSKRWPRELANEIAVELKKRTEMQAKTWLTVLDLACDGEIGIDVQAFVHQLSTCLLTGVSRHRHRLVLMNFPEEALRDFDAYMQIVWFDGLSTGEVEDELQRLFMHLGRVQDARELAEGIMQGLEQPHQNMREIGRRSTAILRKLM